MLAILREKTDFQLYLYLIPTFTVYRSLVLTQRE